MVRSLLLLTIFLALLSCNREHEEIVIGPDKLIGSWVNQQLDDTIWTYQRAGKLKEGEYGFTFKSNNIFEERKNAGWCGTPPISYGDFSGHWTSGNDSILHIKVGYWGGTQTYTWRIVSLDDEHLSVTIVGQEW